MDDHWPQILIGAWRWRRLGWERKTCLELTQSWRISASESCACFPPLPSSSRRMMSSNTFPSIFSVSFIIIIFLFSFCFSFSFSFSNSSRFSEVSHQIRSSEFAKGLGEKMEWEDANGPKKKNSNKALTFCFISNKAYFKETTTLNIKFGPTLPFAHNPFIYGHIILIHSYEHIVDPTIQFIRIGAKSWTCE